MGKLNNTPWKKKKQWVDEEIKDKWKWIHNIPKHMECSKTVPRGKFKLIKAYLKNFLKVFILQRSLLAKSIRKQNKVQSQWKEGHNKDQRGSRKKKQ